MIPGLAITLEGIIRFVGEPLKIQNHGIQRKFAAAKLFDRVLDIRTIPPSPSACDKAKCIARRHWWRSYQSIVSFCTQAQVWSRHEVHFPSSRLEGPRYVSICFAFILRCKR